MSPLARPAALSGLLTLAALLLLPAIGAERWLPGYEPLRLALLLLGAAALVSRALRASAGERTAAWLLALGAPLLLAGLGLDGIRGQRGTLRLAPGQATANFEEAGRGGRTLGLRPLGFSVGLDRAEGDEVALQIAGRGTEPLAPGRSLRHGAVRLASPRTRATGQVARLRIGVNGGSSTSIVELAPDRPGRLGDLVVSLEQYFADFALDPKRQPFSRSAEPRNPAALLRVARGDEVHRVFVLQAMPGVHRLEKLGLAFSLIEIEPQWEVVLQVHRQPFAPLALFGGLALSLGSLLLALRRRESEPQPSPLAGMRLAGAALVASLLLLDGGNLLAWTVGLPSANGWHALAGAGVPFGVSLLAALAGSLLLAAQLVAPSVETRPLSLRALWLSLGAGLVAVAVGVARLAQAGLPLAAARPLAGVVVALALLALSLRSWRLPLVGPLGAERVWPAAAPAALLLALALGWAATLSAGTYATPEVAAAAASALLALAAREPAGWTGARRFLFLLSLLTLLARPGD